jgi:hypothetical protein
MRTVLICHQDAALDREGLVRWLGSFSEVTGVVVLQETRRRAWTRIKKELGRVGWLRFLDVVAFRVFYRLFLAARDRAWEAERLEEIRRRFPGDAHQRVPVLRTHSPNSEEARSFIAAARPDLMIARCKTLLKESIFSIPARGTFVMHPGVCPEYRNAHGCFWALANDDLANVGMTLLRIDRGVDTGPVYGYFTYPFDEVSESHHVVQHRVVHDNLDAIRRRLEEVVAGRARPLDVAGRRSSAWGQPWLTRHLRWKHRARRRSLHEGNRAALS